MRLRPGRRNSKTFARRKNATKSSGGIGGQRGGSGEIRSGLSAALGKISRVQEGRFRSRQRERGGFAKTSQRGRWCQDLLRVGTEGSHNLLA